MKQYRKLDDQGGYSRLCKCERRKSADGAPSHHPTESSSSATSRHQQATGQARDRRVERNVRSTLVRDDEYVPCLLAVVEGLNRSAGWTHRQTLLSYCVTSVSSSLSAKQQALHGQDARLEADSGRYASDAEREAKAQAGLRGRNLRETMFGEEVLKNQLVNEETVEAIIRKRSLDG